MPLALQALICPAFGDRLSGCTVELVEMAGKATATGIGQSLSDLEELLMHPFWFSERMRADPASTAPAAGVSLHELHALLA
jgi:hypothetical protein